MTKELQIYRPALMLLQEPKSLLEQNRIFRTYWWIDEVCVGE